MSDERPTNGEKLVALEVHMEHMKVRQTETHAVMQRYAETTELALADVQARLATMNLNGSAEAIKRIAKLEPGLTKLAENADALVAVAERSEAAEVTRRTLGKWFHLKTLSKLVYAAIGGGILVFIVQLLMQLATTAK